MTTKDSATMINVSPYLQAWVDGLNHGDITTADQAFMPECIIHINGGAQQDLSLNQFKQMVAGLLVAFPDLQFTMEDHFVVSDKAATRWTATGTNTGALGETEATGKSVQISGLIIDHLTDGKVAERWELWDQMGMLQQLGLV